MTAFLSPLLHTAGAVALLLWGTYVIRTGMLRTFGGALRNFLSKTLRNRALGFSAGFFLSSLLQSSTASALLISGLQKKGLVTTVIALAAVLGADFGSAFMVRVLSLPVSAVSPLLILFGTALFLRKKGTRGAQFGRILIGLGIVMLSLSQISAATAPLKQSPELLSVFESLAGTPALSMLLGMVLAFICFSSLAVVIIDAGLVASGALPADAGLWIVIGANLGSAFLAFFTTLGSEPMARRAPVGNCIYRSVCAAGGVVLLIVLSDAFPVQPAQDADAVIWFHIVFNGVAGLIGLIFLNPLAALVDKLLPAKPEMSTDTSALTEDSLTDADSAFRLTAVELEKTCYFTALFWHKTRDLLNKNPSEGNIMLMRQDYAMIKKRCHAVNEYLGRAIVIPMTRQDIQRWEELQSQNAALQSVAREVDKVAQELAVHKCSKHRYFTREGEAELLAAHDRIFDDLETVYESLSPDNPVTREHAQKLLEERVSGLGEEEMQLVQSHIDRVAAGRFRAVETSALHLALLSRFRRLRQKIAEVARLLPDTDTDAESAETAKAMHSEITEEKAPDTLP